MPPKPRPTPMPPQPIPGTPAAPPVHTRTAALTEVYRILGDLVAPAPPVAPLLPPGITILSTEALRADGWERMSRMIHANMVAPAQQLPGFARWKLAYMGALLAAVTLAAWALIILVGLVIDLGNTVQYGAVRTTHLTAAFGLPGETATSGTTVTAVNQGGIGYLFLVPGPGVDHALTIQMPPLDADPDGKQPLLLTAWDADKDGHPDLVIRLGNTRTVFVYLLDLGKEPGQAHLRLPTDEERSRLVLPWN